MSVVNAPSATIRPSSSTNLTVHILLRGVGRSTGRRIVGGAGGPEETTGGAVRAGADTGAVSEDTTLLGTRARTNVAGARTRREAVSHSGGAERGRSSAKPAVRGVFAHISARHGLL